MRKINTQEDEQKGKRKKQIIIGIILVVIMFGSTFGIIVDSFGKSKDSNKVKYNNYEFLKTNGFWILQKDNLNLIFSYNPLQTENINAKVNEIENYYEKPLYIYSESELAKEEINRNLNPQYNSIVQRMQMACPENKKCEENFPIKNCDNNFIIIEETNNSEIVQDKNCVIIRGNSENILKITDEFLFKLFKIKQ